MTMVNKTLTDLFQEHLGAHEYDDFVTKMIRWYYNGGFAKVAWCAISMSYMANRLGILSQFGGKNQNCYKMLCGVKSAVKKSGKGKLWMRDELEKGMSIRRGDVVFILKSDPPMNVGSSKHVTTVYEGFAWKGASTFKTLGGNQSDYIQIKIYPQSQVYAIFRPDYTDAEEPKKDKHPTLRQGDKGSDVKKMQNDLRKIGFSNITGKEMVADGSFGRITANTVVSFQVLTNLKADGVVGPKTWAEIDELLAMPKRTSVAQTRVNVRTGPGTGFPMIAKTYDESGKLIRGNVVDEGEKVTYTVVLNGWLYLPTYNGWSRSKWYNL